MHFQEMLDTSIAHFDDRLDKTVATLLDDQNQTVAVAESITGGLLAGRLTTLPGSSSRFIGGVVCYHPRLKVSLAGVSPSTLREEGEVSSAVALEMAVGIQRLTKSTIGLSTTGLAGPQTQHYPESKLGTVFIGFAFPGSEKVKSFKFTGNRHDIRLQTVQSAMEHLKHYLQSKKEAQQ